MDRRPLCLPLSRPLLRLLFCVCLTVTSASAEELIRGPYLQQTRNRSAIIRWSTTAPEQGAVQIWQHRRWRTVRDVAPATDHELVVRALSPNHAYRYRILDSSGAELAVSSLRTAPLERSSREVRLLIFGDSGTGDENQRLVANQMALRQPHLILHTGDVIYPDGSAEHYDERFFEIYRQLLRRAAIYPALGNHDVPNVQDYTAVFSLPQTERYYSFDYGPAHFIALNTNEDFTTTSAQYQWLTADLAKATVQRKRWRIAFFHHPPWSAGPHGGREDVQQILVPLFERFGVQLVFSGHDHAYERTAPVRVSADGSAVVYVVTGGGGGALYEPAQIEPKMVVYRAEHHFVELQMTRSRLRLRAISPSGVVIDSFTIEQ